MMLTQHFGLEEMIASEVAARRGIDNTPTPMIVERLKETCAGLEFARMFLRNCPIIVTSGYRCSKLNSLIGGSLTSAHPEGYAADIICPAFGAPSDMAPVLARNLKRYDQIILEGTWLHVSFDPQNRRQTLRANFGHGATTYTVENFA